MLAVLSGVAFGLLIGNAVPHLVKGFTRERDPCFLGNGPVPNLIGGWLCLTAAMVLGFAVFKAVSNTYS